MKYLVIDTESTKLPRISPWMAGSYLCSVGLTDTDGVCTIYLFNHITEKCVEYATAVALMQKAIDDSDIIVFHNAKHDISWLRHSGLKVDHKQVWDTMVAEYLLYGQNPAVTLSLDATAGRYKLGSKVDKMKEYWDSGFETDEIPWNVHKVYLEQDCELTRQVFLKQVKSCEKAGLLNLAYLCSDMTRVLATMESNGVLFDVERANEYCVEYTQRVKDIEQELISVAGITFNPASSDQLGAVLFGGTIKREVQELVAKQRANGTYRVYTRKADYIQKVKGLGFTPHDSTKSKKTGKYSTGNDALKWLVPTTTRQEKFLLPLFDSKKSIKFISTLVSQDGESGLISKVGRDGKLHPSFNPCTTRTGRLSSSNPNGQNFPRSGTSPIKSLIKSELGVIVNADLSQIEWRIAAAISDDKLMCDEIIHNLDVHNDSAERFFGVDPSSPEFKNTRQTAKTFNFRMLYGGTAMAFFYDVNMPRFEVNRWKDIVQGFYKKYATLRQWQLNNAKLVTKHGYIRNPSGRYLTFKLEEDPYNGDVKYNLSTVCNYPPQSGSGDVMYLCLVRIHDEIIKRGLKTKPLLIVHDSVVADCPLSEVEEFGRICLDAFTSIPAMAKEHFGWEIPVPITGEVSVGVNYGEVLKDYKEKTFTKENLKSTLTRASTILYLDSARLSNKHLFNPTNVRARNICG